MSKQVKNLFNIIITFYLQTIYFHMILKNDIYLMNNGNEISDIIKEYLKVNGLKTTLDNFEKEEKQRLSKNLYDTDKNTKIGKIILNDKDKSKDISSLQDNYKTLEKKHQSILQCGRQILSIAKTCLQHLQNIKDVSK